MTLSILEQLQEAYLQEYYASSDDDDFRHDFSQDFPFWALEMERKSKHSLFNW